MRFVIDGYNLMHALGMAPKPGGMSLERSRVRFVEWLAVAIRSRIIDVCVVFDSQHAGGNEQELRGIRLKFANARTADDVIEETIQAERTPGQLTVISSDNRLIAAATRRGCTAWRCSKFVDWLQSAPPKETEPTGEKEEEKPSTLSRLEMDEWLQRFGS